MKKIILIISFIVLGLFNQHAIADVVYVHNDALGSPIMESDANGAIIPGSHSHYKPFGETLEASKDDVGYTGHLNDSDLGLTYMQARYYDPVIGRFYSNDPVGYTAKNPVMSFNRYMYVNNNPYKYTDPDGKLLLQAVGFVIGAIQAGQAVQGSNASFGAKALAITAGGFIGAFTGGKASGAVAAVAAKIAGSKVLQTTAQVTAGGLTGTISGAGSQVTADLLTGQEITMEKTVIAGGKGLVAGVAGGVPSSTGVAVATTLFTETALQAGEALASESQPIEKKENE